MNNKSTWALWSTFRIPLAIGILTATGLFCALLGDGAWDGLSWMGLGVPAAISLWVLWPRRSVYK